MIQVIRELHDTPEHAASALLLAGGRNRFGEPNFRAVWGQNRLDWIGGRWTDHADDGSILREVIELRYTHKYAMLNRWIIERWTAPEVYGSPTSWAKQTQETENDEHGRPRVVMNMTLGPYPSRGDYEHVFTLESPPKLGEKDPQFLQLTANIARYVARMVELSRGMKKSESKTALHAREEQKDKDYDTWAENVLG